MGSLWLLVEVVLGKVVVVGGAATARGGVGRISGGSAMEP